MHGDGSGAIKMPSLCVPAWIDVGQYMRNQSQPVTAVHVREMILNVAAGILSAKEALPSLLLPTLPGLIIQRVACYVFNLVA